MSDGVAIILEVKATANNGKTSGTVTRELFGISRDVSLKVLELSCVHEQSCHMDKIDSSAMIKCMYVWPITGTGKQ